MSEFVTYRVTCRAPYLDSEARLRAIEIPPEGEVEWRDGKAFIHLIVQTERIDVTINRYWKWFDAHGVAVHVVHVTAMNPEITIGGETRPELEWRSFVKAYRDTVRAVRKGPLTEEMVTALNRVNELSGFEPVPLTAATVRSQSAYQVALDYRQAAEDDERDRRYVRFLERSFLRAIELGCSVESHLTPDAWADGVLTEARLAFKRIEFARKEGYKEGYKEDDDEEDAG